MEKTEASLILGPALGGQDILIPALDGRSRVEVNKVFESVVICSNFPVLKEQRPGRPTPATYFRTSEVIGDATFMEIFGAISGDWEAKWIPQSQIAKLCESCPNWFSPYLNFFLAKIDEDLPINPENPVENLCVFRVGPHSSKSDKPFRAYAGRLEYQNVWLGVYKNRVFFKNPLPV